MTAINSRPVLVTGAAGSIGAAFCQRLLQRGDCVIGIDNLNSYYDPALKQARQNSSRFWAGGCAGTVALQSCSSGSNLKPMAS